MDINSKTQFSDLLIDTENRIDLTQKETKIISTSKEHSYLDLLNNSIWIAELDVRL